MKRRADFEQSGVMIKAHNQDKYFTNSLRFEPIDHIDASSVWTFEQRNESCNKDGIPRYRLKGVDGTYDVLFTMSYNKQNDVFLFKNENGGYLHADNRTGYGYFLRPLKIFDYQIIDKQAQFEVIGKEKSEIIENSFIYQTDHHSDCAALSIACGHDFSSSDSTSFARGE